MRVVVKDKEHISLKYSAEGELMETEFYKH